MQKVWEFLWSGKIGHVSCLLLYVLGKDVDNVPCVEKIED